MFLYLLIFEIYNVVLTKAIDTTDFRKYDDIQLWDFFYGHFYLYSMRELSKNSLYDQGLSQVSNITNFRSHVQYERQLIKHVSYHKMINFPPEYLYKRAAQNLNLRLPQIQKTCEKSEI